MLAHRRRRPGLLRTAVAAALSAALLLPPMAWTAARADPPPWAPAYGYRHKHRHHDDRGDDYREHHDYRDDDHYREDDGYREDGQVRRETAPLPQVVTVVRGGHCDRQAAGAVIGGVVGGVLGSNVGEGNGRTAATVAGAILGVLVGSSVGRHMDEADRNCLGQALEYGEDRRPVAWRNPDTGADYTVTPVKTFRNDGRYCREYVAHALVGDRRQEIHGTACRQPDGSWKAIN